MVTNPLLILVPARGGSKGLPRKNIRQLGGVPLLQWSREAVEQAGLDAKVVLSTDDTETAEVGRACGLQVPFMRPAEFATDTASAVSVVRHALDWYAERKIEFENILLLQPTSPFRSPAALAQSVEFLADSNVDGVLGCKPIHRALYALYYTDENGLLSSVVERSESGDENHRRQNVRTLYTPNGALYLVRTAAFRREHTVMPKRTRAIVMDQVASLDIDDAVDWSVAEALVAAKVTWRK